MLTRRNVLWTGAALGVGAAFGGIALAQGFKAAPEAGSLMPTKGKVDNEPLPTNAKPKKNALYVTPQRFGMGGVQAGNGYGVVSTDEQIEKTFEAAWAAGVRYFDTSPWYGLSLSERRFGDYLRNHKREEYVLSTKIGRILTPREGGPKKKTAWANPSPFDYRYDYSAEATRRSVEDSLQRLGVSSLDVVFIHDVSPDNGDMGADWVKYYEQAEKGAMVELAKMKKEGMIKGWGFGINRPDALYRAIEVSEPDIFLLATQYSLLEHEEALTKTFPLLDKKGIHVVVGAPLNAGYLAGRSRYDYSGKVPKDAPKKRERMTAIADKHGIDLRTAALQFAAAPSTVASIIPGARNAEQIKANVASMKVNIPAAFWEELKTEKLISAQAPVPTAGGKA